MEPVTPETKPTAKSGRRVILYIGADPKRDGSMFYLNLFWCLMTIGQQHGVEMIPVIDLRPSSQNSLPPPDIARIRSEGPVDGLVGFMVHPAMTVWMEETGLPWTVHAAGKSTHYVDFDYSEMVRVSLRRLADLGCKSAGLMVPSYWPDAAFLEDVDAVSQETGVAVNYEWILVSRESQEVSGYAHLSSLWDMKNRPEGLIVFPDRAARGVVSAILEKRIQVPGELRLILHRNAESPYVVPLPCDWIEVSVNAVASALLDNLKTVWAGAPMRRQRLQLNLVKGQG